MIVATKKTLLEYIKIEPRSLSDITEYFCVKGGKVYNLLESPIRLGEIEHGTDKLLFTHVKHIVSIERLYVLIKNEYLRQEMISLEAGRILEVIEKIGNEYMISIPTGENKGLTFRLHPRMLRKYE